VYAQVFELPGAEQSERLNRSIHGELIPALRAEGGFCGALSLVRRETGEMLLLVFWETENEATRPLLPCLAALLDELGTTGRSGCVPEIWEVGARA
jgi:hypothetical protein